MIVTFSTTIENNTTPHTHRVHELIVGSKGTALLCANGEQHAISSKQIVLVPSGVCHHYALVGKNKAAEVTFICFDGKPLERYLSPTLQARFERLLINGVTTGHLDNAAAGETAALVKMMKRALGNDEPFSQEKAGGILNTILTSHLTATESPERTTKPDHYEKIQKVVEWVDNHLAEEIDIDTSAAVSHMSRSTFTRCFKQYTNSSFSKYVTKARLRFAADLLSQENLPVGEVAYQSGFRNLGHFYNQFQRHYGMTPSQYRKVSMEMTSPVAESTGQGSH